MSTTYVHGAVTREGTSPVEGIPGATVQLFASDGLRLRRLATTLSGDKGQFAFDLTKAGPVPAQFPNRTIRVRLNRRELRLEKRIQWANGEDPGDIVLCVMDETACPAPVEDSTGLTTAEGQLWGRILHEDGTPAAGALVQLWPLDPFDTTVTLFGFTYATSTGFYQFLPPDEDHPLPHDFQVKAFIPGTTPVLVATSQAQYGATFSLRVDLRTSDDAYRAATEWYRINLALGGGGSPLVPTDHLDSVDARAAAILSGKSGWDIRRIVLWTQACRLATAWAPTAFALTAEQLYGLLREGFPTTGSAILARQGLGVDAALAAAYRDNIVSAAAVATDAVTALLAALQAARLAELASDRFDSFASILQVGSGGLTDDQVTDFCDAYVTFPGAPTDFWSYLGTYSNFSPPTSAALTEAQRRITLGTLALGWAPAVGQILIKISGGPASDVATLDGGDWDDVAAATNPLPAGLDGDDEGEQRATLSALLQAHAEAMFPSEIVMHTFSTLSGAGGLVGLAGGWVSDNLTFNLQTGRVTGSDDAANAARALQRVYRIAPSVGGTAAIQALLTAGVTSAHHVRSMGRTRFVNAFSGALGADGALEMFQKARSLTAMTRTFLVQAAPTLMGGGLPFLPWDGVDATSLADYADLYSSTTSCACEECRSIAGPAAYLVELLQWLSYRDATSGTACDVLLARRPDLGNLELSCENTTRAMPYIDLSLEVLEDIVDPDNATTEEPAVHPLPGDPHAHDTSAETPELLASPEITNEEAYGVLLAATATMETPFNRPVEEARAFLAHLGIDRVELMRACGGLAYGTNAPSDDGIGLEELRLSGEMWAALTATSTDDASEGAFWPEGTTDLASQFEVVQLRRRAELTFPDILDLVHSRFVNGQSTCLAPTHLAISWDDEGDINTYQVVVPGTPSTPPTYADWARFRAFARIWRARDWSMLDLDKVLYGLGVSAWSPTALAAADLGSVHYLARRAGISVVEVVSWNAAVPMDTYADRDSKDHPVPSLYDRVYLNPSLVSAADRETGAFALDPSSRAELTLYTAYIKDNLAAIQAALNVSADELTALVAQLAALLSTTPDLTTMTLANLSTLYRYASLARVAGVLPSELIALLGAGMSGLSPFTSWADAVTLLEDVQTWRASGWTVDEVNYVVTHATADRVAPTDAFLQSVLGKVRASLAAAYGAMTTTTTEDGLRAVVAKTLAEALGVDRAVVDEWRTKTFTNVPGVPTLDGDPWVFTFASALTVTTTSAGVVAARSVVAPAGTGFYAWVDSVLTPVTSTADLSFIASSDLTASIDAGFDVTVSDDDEWTFAFITTDGTAIPPVTAQFFRLNGPSSVSLFSVADIAIAGSIGSDTTIDGVAGAAIAATYTDGSGTHTVNIAAGDALQFVIAASDPATVLALQVPAGSPILIGATSTSSGLGVEFDPADLSPTSPVSAIISRTDPLFRLLRHAVWDVAPSGSDPASDLTRTAFEDDYTLLDILAKTAFVLNKVSLDADERAAWAGTTSWALPAYSTSAVAFGTTSGASYASLLNLVRLFAQRARLPGSDPTFASLLGTLTPSTSALTAGEVGSAISSRTAWDDDLVTGIAGGFLPIASGATTSLLTASGLATFLDLLAMARRAAAPAGTVVTWAGDPGAGAITAPVSASVVTAARSRYATPEAWAAVARPIRDVLRKRQRDALVTYILATTNAHLGSDDKLLDSEDLYQYLLIDVNMNPEMLTSRIKQAACTAQLFIHRLMLGLEPSAGVTLTDEDRQEWEWMRTFRIWQAARMVFLYPENWIEPDLRDDKTPFYKALEQDLGQGDVTADRVEQAALDYLDKLHDVSALTVLGYYVQKETVDGDTIDLLHVVARTAADPAIYWYRRREDSTTWTPWEKVEAGVAGSMILLYVYNRRLMLFWVTSTVTGTAPSSADDDSPPQYHLEFRLSWSSYRDGKWSPKATTDAVVVGSDHTDASELQDLSIYLPIPVETDGLLTVWMGRKDPTAETGDVVYGGWTLDPCRGDLVAADATDDDDALAGYDYGVSGAQWVSPGLNTGSASGSPTGPATLKVLKGDYDADGIGDADTADVVQLLSKLKDGTVVTTRQYGDFVSQAPFFVQWSDRCYFVEYVEPAVATAAPAAAAVSSKREGTWTPNYTVTTGEGGPIYTQSPEPTPIDDTAYALFVSPSAYTSDGAAAAAVAEGFHALTTLDSPSTLVASPSGYVFSLFYHPYTCQFVKEARRDGIMSLLDPDPDGATTAALFRQQLGEVEFSGTFGPDTENVGAWQEKTVDFGFTGSYSNYNWETFFHTPFLVAIRLSEQQRFADAMDWFHTIFDPRTANAVPSGYPDSGKWWKVKPFLDPVSAPVTDWTAFTAAAGGTAATDFEQQVAAWQDDPFNPHLLARMRPGTYQKTVVIRYIRNLLDWGDYLFTQDTIEALNEATQLYVFAKQILGTRPEQIAASSAPTYKTYNDIKLDLDAFGNATIVLENAFTPPVVGYGSGSGRTSATDGVGSSTYFCIPPNEKLYGLWDLVDDRLFKLRNGRNIKGVRRSLALFEPPIDPGLLVRASAAGVDVQSAASDQALPSHRFPVLLAKAQALAGTARGLGQSLLGALEKQDGEGLALLRAGQELAVQRATSAIKQSQVDDAQASWDAAVAQKATTTARRRYYEGLVAGKWTGLEKGAAAAAAAAAIVEGISAGLQTVAAVASVFPDIEIGFPCNAVITGAKAVSEPASFGAKALGIAGATARGAAAFLATAASYQRRAKDWEFQAAQADLELDQLAHQVASAQSRHRAAQGELALNERQIAQSEQTQEWMTSKFTSQDLYRWMSGQLASSYYQAYQMAVAYAKKAEACYQHELGRPSDTFVQPIYWDSSRKGLLAADLLTADLDRMDGCYLDNDTRQFELTKSVSLQRLDPVAVIALQQGGEAYFALPEALFDVDCPGHYFRRIQSVSVTVACVGGPMASVNCELTMTAGAYRNQPVAGSTYLTSDSGLPEAMVTSSGQEDSGLFQFDLRDPKYLPFERRGLISSWRLRLTSAVPTFDWTSITDVLLRVRYTALDGGEDYRSAVIATLFPQLLATLEGGFDLATGTTPETTGLATGLVASRDYPDELYAAQIAGGGSFAMAVDLTLDVLPYLAQAAKTVTLSKILVLVEGVSTGAFTAALEGDLTTADAADVATGLWGFTAPTTSTITTTPKTLTITLAGTPADVADVAIVLLYSLT